MSFLRTSSQTLFKSFTTSTTTRTMSTATATAHGVTIATTSKAENVEGNKYFPPGDLNMAYFKPSAAGTSSVCGWKGKASYYDVHVGDTIIRDAAWYYPNTTTARAKSVEGYVAFYKNKVNVA